MELCQYKHGGLEQRATMMTFRIPVFGVTVAHYHHLVAADHNYRQSAKKKFNSLRLHSTVECQSQRDV